MYMYVCKCGSVSFFFFKQKTAYEVRISDWSSDVCSSDLKNRKRKKRLASMLAEFQASTAALPDGAVVLGDHGAISWFNTAAVQLLGLREIGRASCRERVCQYV